jgi:WD40 repeat protein
MGRQVTALCPIPTGTSTVLASASKDGSLRLWKPGCDEPQQLARLHRGPVNALCAVTADERAMLASAGDDRTVRLWDIDGRPGPVTRCESAVTALCSVDIDGRPLVAAASDCAVRLWDPAGSVAEREVPMGLSAGVTVVCMVPAGRVSLLAAGDEEGGVRDLEPVEREALGQQRPPRHGQCGLCRTRRGRMVTRLGQRVRHRSWRSRGLR